MKRTIQIINPRPDFSLSLRLDKGIGATYAPGEIVRISFRTSNASYVTLFGYDSRGNIRLLFPNQNQKYSLLEANREYYIDYIIERGTTPGIEYIQGFATTNPILITRDMERSLEVEFMPVIEEDTDLFIPRIRGILTGLPLPLWISSEILHYQVVERRPGTSQLYITTQPEGADVFLNERYAGQTPLTLEQLEIGEYIVWVELSGYESWERKTQIIDNRTTFLSADLQRTVQYGSIAIRCNEDIARIYLDGQFKRLTQANRDIVLEEVSDEFHDVGITLSGYNDWFQRVEVRPNQRLQLTINLEKIMQNGSLEISCNVDNAMIYLDGNY
ncbi:MAG: PEGA domain-containing protein [Atribacterota bacterium]|nr:PEGA domain-containing protein [Atribacterota bacterium]MDD4895643.1 PEGA domain-containing protein [Atribacterota bacterium]MDD5637039.1 PEGA domain-containing protein [Atribacterota bacterium]